MNPTLFTKGEYSWAGGFYELAIELGPGDDDRLDAAIRALWAFPALFGAFHNRDAEPETQIRYSPSLATWEAGRSQYGILALGDGARVACAAFVVREEESGIDWLTFCIPIGSLGDVLPVGAFPFGGMPSQSWREPLEELLQQIARHVDAAAPFALALIGHEVSGEIGATKLRASGGVPSERWIGYLYRRESADNALEPLTWFPPTIYAAPYSPVL